MPNWNVPPATSRLSAKATMWCMVWQKTIKRCMIRWWSRALSPQSSDHWEHKNLKSHGVETYSEGLSVAKTFQEQRCRQGDALRWFANWCRTLHQSYGVRATTHRFSCDNASELLVINELMCGTHLYIYKCNKDSTDGSAAKLAAKSKKKAEIICRFEKT